MQNNLDRFLKAQDGFYETVIAELQRGKKQSHWMWFIFPQIHGLGDSETARWFSIVDRQEAGAYFDHPILGERFRECTKLVLDSSETQIENIFGEADAIKFRSSMTLFREVEPHSEVSLCSAALTKYFASAPDERTLEIITGDNRRSLER